MLLVEVEEVEVGGSWCNTFHASFRGSPPAQTVWCTAARSRQDTAAGEKRGPLRHMVIQIQFRYSQAYTRLQQKELPDWPVWGSAWPAWTALGV